MLGFGLLMVEEDFKVCVVILLCSEIWESLSKELDPVEIIVEMCIV